MKKNLLINVNLKWGIVGLFSSPRRVIQQIIENYNHQGYSVRLILNPNPNPLYLILCVIILILTCFIYSPAPSYMILFEKENK